MTTAVLLNTRSLLMGISVAPALCGGRLRRFATAQLVSDESWAVGQVEPGRWDRRLIVGAGSRCTRPGSAGPRSGWRAPA